MNVFCCFRLSCVFFWGGWGEWCFGQYPLSCRQGLIQGHCLWNIVKFTDNVKVCRGKYSAADTRTDLTGYVPNYFIQELEKGNNPNQIINQMSSCSERDQKQIYSTGLSLNITDKMTLLLSGYQSTENWNPACTNYTFWGRGRIPLPQLPPAHTHTLAHMCVHACTHTQS